MSMGRKGAILMLAIVVLWAATPVLGFLASASCHPCCRAIMMDCDSAIVAAHPCCQIQSSTAVPPAQAAVTSTPAGSSQTLASLDLPDPSVLTRQGPSLSKAPPPRSQSGGSTILRI